MKRLFTSLSSFDAHKINDSLDTEFTFDESLLDSLVELVGSEDTIEQVAKKVFDDIQNSFKKNELEITDINSVENLVIASLIVELVELGHLDPTEADEIIKDNL